MTPRPVRRRFQPNLDRLQSRIAPTTWGPPTPCEMPAALPPSDVHVMPPARTDDLLVPILPD